MNFDEVKNSIATWVKPELDAKNLFLVDIKFSMGKKIEVYIDSDEGVHIDDCAQISRFIEKNLDGSGIVPENYILEVSSPGMDNPLKVPRQYNRRIGRILEVLKNDGVLLEAQLTAVTDTGIKLKEVVVEKKKKKKTADDRPQTAEEQPKEFELKFEEIKRALLQFKF